MQQLLTSIGRNVIVVNIDPANDNLTYKCDLSIYELITLDDVMKNMSLGPNGGLLFAIEYLEENLNWLLERLNELCSKTQNPYLIFDFPGQIELYTHHKSLKNIIEYLSNKLDYRLCNVNLVDSHYCTDPGKSSSQPHRLATL
jgi:GTPase SAR1 family protein